MQSLVSYEQFDRELREEKVTDRERRAELKAAIVLKNVNYSDLFVGEYAPMARSVVSQYNRWVKSDSAPSLEDSSLLINVPTHYASLRDYILTKYSGTKAKEWTMAFNDSNFANSVMMFLQQKCFEAKSELEASGRTAFLTQIGLEYYVRQSWDKRGRSLLHEAIGKANKLYGDSLAPDDVINQIGNFVHHQLRQEATRLARMMAKQRFGVEPLGMSDAQYFGVIDMLR